MDESAGADGNGGRMPTLLAAVAQVLGPDDLVAGAGFLIGEDTLVTCAHVVAAVGSGPGGLIRLVFPHADGSPAVEGLVLEEPWRAPEAEDVAVVRLTATPQGASPPALGSAAGRRGHEVRSFGFPTQAPPGGHFGFGVAGDILPAVDGRGAHLQLTSANDLTTGFSGGPVVDEVTGLVIGMLTEIAAPDEHDRGQAIAYVTPTQVLREVWPELTETDVHPYRGLESFTAEHTQWFEGRKDAVRQMLAGLAEHQRLTLLLGPSGSGKSSLIQAGVLPALAAGVLPGSDRWLQVVARPGRDLLQELERAGLPGAESEGIAEAVVHRLAAEPAHERVLLVMDQFEELFTQTTADGQWERRLTAAEQITAAVSSQAKLTVVLVMRDDFYPQLAGRAAGLLKAAMPGLLNMPGTLSQDDLHDIVTQPALRAGAHFEQGLPEQIISDVLATTPEGAVSRHAPVTVLPLLELALSQLWQRREEGRLTHDAYRRIGGVTGSLASWCDTALDQLTPEQRPVAQRILTSLVRPADPRRNIPAVREQVPVQELRELAADVREGPDREGEDAIDTVLEALTRHRIITTRIPRVSLAHDARPEPPVAELIHDALIRDWGTLREWVRQDHRFYEWFVHTREQARRYAEGEDQEDLIGGTALAEGLEWAQQRRLPQDVAAFLKASRQHQQAVTRRTRRLNTVLASLLVLALITTVLAVRGEKRASNGEQQALSRELAAQSRTLIETNPDVASLLAVKAYHTSHTSQAAESLRSAAALPLIKSLMGHKGTVWDVAYSPDGNTIATCGADATVRLWDVATGKGRILPVGHTKPVYGLTFGRNGMTLATAGADGTVRLWDIAAKTSRSRIIIREAGAVFTTLTFSNDGATLAVGGKDGSVRLWNSATRQSHTIPVGHTKNVHDMAFSRDGRRLATGSFDGSLRIWDVNAKKSYTISEDPKQQVRAVAFSRDGRTLAAGGGDRQVTLWSVGDKITKNDTLSGHRDYISSLAFSPDGKILVSGSADTNMVVWDTKNGDRRAILRGHTDTVWAVAFHPDSETIATSSEDGTARVWGLDTGNAYPLGETPGKAEALAFSPDGAKVATVNPEGNVSLWDVSARSSRTLPKLHTGPVITVAFSPNGKSIATGGADGTVRLWDLGTDESSIIPMGHTDAVISVAFRPPNGNALASGGKDATVRLWDFTAKRSRIIAMGQTDAVNQVAFSPDGSKLACGSHDNTAQVWDMNSDKHLVELAGHTKSVESVAFRDEQSLATGSADATLRLWEIGTGKTVRTMKGHNWPVFSVAFSDDGEILGSGGSDGNVRVWKADTGNALITLYSHQDSVFAVAFRPHSKFIASSSADNTVRLHNADPLDEDEALHTVCAAVNRDLSPEERTAYLPDQATGPGCSAG
ncbi:trypsin-like peptidase domain-containing protein [Streptomyces virginiae]|uniref:nSTAND1 domain-containing NTPase n=1 Tax=Streptomyces virginiae TaxID=1961 RepID=UPI0036D14EDD